MVIDNKIDLNIIRVGLESANFGDAFAIRDCLVSVINSLQIDLDEVGFEPSDHTKAAIESLENELSDSESPVHETEIRLLSDDEDTTNVRELLNIDEDVETTTVVNVDEELDEFNEP